MAQHVTDIVIYMDGEEAALRLHSGCLVEFKSTSIADFRALRENRISRVQTVTAVVDTVSVHRALDHVGIKRNEHADALI
ncbi:BgTH12-03199 [Blumeria graminis f. sp. triticale]|uniref:BgTH12-03199 n=1 Tax=Blumeria graminis f. sp. triticale TaxID=1689686 RepID=A0A9W4D7V9_BLUGR|nr:BgTH12-03199 [Blumeria graminis f. sp. triticale]